MTPEVALIISSIITVFGWWAVYLFNLSQQQRQLVNEAKLNVYRELWSLRGLMQKISSRLSTCINNPPFIHMESLLIYGNVTKKLFDVQRGEMKAVQRWLEYMSELITRSSEHSDTVLKFFRSLEMWIHVMPKLEKAEGVLFHEYEIVREVVNGHISFLHSLNNQQWRAWDQVKIRVASERVSEQIIGFLLYCEDMMGLIHNVLVAPLFGYKKYERRTTDSRYKVLGVSGLH